MTVDNISKVIKIIEHIFFWKLLVYDNIGEYVKRKEYLNKNSDRRGKL